MNFSQIKNYELKKSLCCLILVFEFVKKARSGSAPYSLFVQVEQTTAIKSALILFPTTSSTDLRCGIIRLNSSSVEAFKSRSRGEKASVLSIINLCKIENITLVLTFTSKILLTITTNPPSNYDFFDTF